MVLAEALKLPEIHISNKPNFQEAKDPYLCPWADWYYLVIMAYWLQNRDNSKSLVEQHVLSANIITEEINQVESKSRVKVLHKGFLIPGNTHKNWSGKRPTKTGAQTGLVLSGEHKGMIVIPNSQGYSVGRMLKPSSAYKPFYDLKATAKPGDTRVEYIETQKDILDRAVAVENQAESLNKLFESISATLTAVTNN